MHSTNSFVKLYDVCEIKSGGTPSRKTKGYYTDGNIPWFKTGDLKSKYLDLPGEFITQDALENSSAKLFPPQSVLLAMYGASIGSCAILKSSAATNQACAAFLPSKKILPQYLYYFFISHKKSLVKLGVGGAQPNISLQILKELKIPLPPLEDQKRIVKILDQADALRQKRKQAIALLDEYVKSVFLEMFGDTTKFEIKEIQKLVRNEKGSMRTGPFGSALKHSEFVSEGIPVLGIDNVVDNTFKWKKLRFISNEKYENLKQYTVKPEDVLVTIMGTIGRSAVVPIDIGIAVNTKHLACITVDQNIINPHYLSYCLINDPYLLFQLTGNKRGAIMDGLNLGIIKRLKVKIPTINDQYKFVSIKKTIETIKAKMDEQAQELDTQFQVLMQKAFKGEL